MVEAREEATYIPQHRKRLAFFFAAMRHHRDALKAAGRDVRYVKLDDAENTGGFAGEIARHARALSPERLIVLEPGDFRVAASLRRTATALNLPLEFREDRHFICRRSEFDLFAAERKTLVMENFYRRMRVAHDVLMDGDRPVGGAWNFDRENRASFGAKGPPLVPPPPSFTPDAVTGEVLAMVTREFPDAPGAIDGFDFPVTAKHARHALDDFVTHRLPLFGRYQDAMAAGQPFLFHSLLSGPLNLHLLDPRDAIAAARDAYDTGHAPLAAVEGFVRQILGWREFVRGVYWRFMPDYAELNALGADRDPPRFFWTGETDMACLADCGRQLHDHAYAHHIQRLMVFGLWATLSGVRPYAFHEWHMAMFWDAIDWVSLPNTLGMATHGDGGVVGTKPYCASGKYIDRMSDYCASCRFDPARATGDDACPFTTLYWDFLARHEQRFAQNRRMVMQVRNLQRKDEGELRMIRRRAEAIRDGSLLERG
jgi:deoxyribodipyrimidine photolyase-related protein